MKKDKRGVSPLIAAVLLVGFAVAMAAFVSTFVIKKTEEFKPESFIQDSALCESVSISYELMKNNNGDILLNFDDAGDINIMHGLTIKNKGPFTVYKITINPPGQKSQEYAINDGIKPGKFLGGETIADATELPLGFKKTTTDNTIKIVPWIKDPEKEEDDPEKNVVCTKRPLYINPVDICKKVIHEDKQASECSWAA